jgi:hypothetical protein
MFEQVSTGFQSLLRHSIQSLGPIPGGNGWTTATPDRCRRPPRPARGGSKRRIATSDQHTPTCVRRQRVTATGD